jgi:spore coat polysaccharide biosynthesis protein SpsF
MEQEIAVLAILQARVGSTRLPGKVLADVVGKPMIEWQIERILRASTIDRLIVATTINPEDDPIERLAMQLGVDVIRGSEADVLSRFIQVLDRYPAKVVVRLTADCPLVDPRIIDLCVQQFNKSKPVPDYLSNALLRTFPDGLDVEVIDATVLRIANMEAARVDEKEHVTRFIHQRPERFALKNVPHKQNLGHLRWTVDENNDLKFVRAIFGRLVQSNESFGFEDILSLLESEPELSKINTK